MLRAFENFKLLYKLLVPLSLLVVVMGAILWTAAAGTTELNAATRSIVEYSAARRALVLTLIGALNDATVQEKNIILATDEEQRSAFFKQYQGSIAEAIDAVDRLIGLARTPEQRSANELLKSSILEFQQAADKSVGLGMKNEQQAAFKVSAGETREARRKVVALARLRSQRIGDELDHAKSDVFALGETLVTRLFSFAAAGLTCSLGLLLAIVVVLVVRPLSAMTGAMQRLAAGDLEVEVAGADRKDEVGMLARALIVFKSNAIETERLAANAEAQKQQAAADQKVVLDGMATAFENSVGNIVGAVSSASVEMQSAARSLTSIADDASRQATAVSAAATQATSSVETVAAAAEELSASVTEIGRQVTKSSEITHQAVEEVRQTNVTIDELAKAASKIGEVVGLIQQIAGQTNLLALNATIEAARAGDAGKGFAVVANEVKALANQTARATDEISGQVTAIQASTNAAVGAIQHIGRTIDEVNEIAGAIAAAVEEQSAATREIAVNVQQAATGTSEVSSNISGVTRASGEVGAAAALVLNAASDLSQQSERLEREVKSFLATVRTA